MSIYFTSDLHFAHDKPFIWKARGFSSVEEMNEEIIKRINSRVSPIDDLYILGDVIMGESDKTIEYLNRLNGRITIIRGNHDNEKRVSLYKAYGYKVFNAKYLDYNHFRFYLSHYPSDTSNDDDSKRPLNERILSLCGHTHSVQECEYTGSFNVGVDAHACYPISIDEIIERFEDNFV